MASPVNAVLCALIATGFWTLLGYALARHLLPRVLAIGAAAVIGWAVHSAVALPVYVWTGLSPIAVVGIGAVCILAAGFSLSLPAPASEAGHDPTIPAWAFAAAAVLALVPAAAILPKFYGDAVQLADSIFDHAKTAMIDATARLGVPPVNPCSGNSAHRRVCLLLSLAFQRGRGRARDRRHRLGSRYRADLVYRLRVPDFDDGTCHLAQQTLRSRYLGGGACHRGLAVGDA